jgi:hypothetical protein
MSDDWRLRVKLEHRGAAPKLAELLAGGEAEHELDDGFQDRVAVSHDGDEVFAYAGTREQAQRASELIARLAGDHGWRAEQELRRWHPVAEEWEDPDAPLPADSEDLAEEHAELIESEREASAAHGHPEWEVRVECPSHRECAALADKLESEGIRTVRRWRYLLVGAVDEDGAAALAKRLEQEAPQGSAVTVEGTYEAVRETLPRNPFAVFGGLGG